MKMRHKVWLAFAGIILLATGATLIDYPKGPNIYVGDISREIKVHLGLDLQGGASLLYTADVSKIPNDGRVEALDGVRDVIERRINAFGVSEPTIQTVRSGDDWRIEVELPGITDISEAINRIGETPLLEFKTEGPPPEFSEDQKTEIKQKNNETKTKAQDVLNRIVDGEDFAAVAREVTEDPGSKDKGGDLGEFEQGQMVAPFDEVVFQKAEVGKMYPELVQTDFGFHMIRVDERTEASTNEKGENVPAKAKAHHILLRTLPEKPPVKGPFYRDVVLTGQQLKHASVTYDQANIPSVSLEFNDEGREKFAQVTRDNIGKKIAIYLDNQLLSDPVVQQEIPNGQAIITGNFSIQEVRQLVQRLNAGALPVPVTLISQQNIGPTLGQQSIERSVVAGMIGLLLLAFFMISYYRFPGLLAVIALGLYSIISLALFKLWPVTLTLAGIAGFILSIGMAVDANVLIFERMKEELRAGKPLAQAIDDGFLRAWTSIRDSNASSLITCFILYWFGSSLVRGFAVTLAIGIVVSMFSAISVTRTLLRLAQPRWLWLYGVRRSQHS